MNNSDPYESLTASLHPTVRKWLQELAQADYDGNLSAALTGLIAYDRGVRNAKKLKGQTHRHTVTAGLVNRRETLESVIREIEGTEPGFNALTWLEIQKGEKPRS